MSSSRLLKLCQVAKVGRGHRFEIARQTLHRLYVEENLTTAEIGKLLGCSYDTVRVRLIEYGIPRKPKRRRPDTKQSPESNAKRSASHKALWDARGRVTPEVVLRLQRADWKARRLECYERDGWTCRDCQRKCWGRSDARRDRGRWISAHHIVARRDGGTDELENLLTLCTSCHQRRERS